MNTKTGEVPFESGLQLSRDYYFNVAAPALKKSFPGLFPRLAAGLAGNGSECFGYDDEISRDHDWGTDFFLWTLEEDADMIPALRDWKSSLLTDCPPRYPRKRSEYGAHVGVMTCGGFYSSLIGAPEGPQTQNEWLRAPEDNFALAVNGEVFADGPGVFSKTRKYLIGYYPEDIRRKRIASRCMALAQTGQYNHERIFLRGDIVTMQSLLARFTDNALALTFLLNKVYKPYYKWAYRAAGDLPVLGAETARLLLSIAEAGAFNESAFSLRKEFITELCALFAAELRTQELSVTDDWFLTTHAEEVQRSISDDFLRSLPTQYEI